jgi:peptidoglycan/LPS O-acetylase OafA/YrhL
MAAYYWIGRVRWPAWLFVAMLAVLVAAARLDLLFAVSPLALSYAIFWMAARLPLRQFGRRMDLSYGLYIYAAPLQQAFIYLGLTALGLPVFVAASLGVATAFAWLSWTFIERPALAAKDAGWRDLLPGRRPPAEAPSEPAPGPNS